MTSLIEHGAEPANAVLDESGFNVRTFNLDPMRDYKYRQDGSSRLTVYMRGENPRLEGRLQGEPIRVSGALAGLAIVHPGVAVALANLPNSTTENGFVFTSSTKVIVLNPKIVRSDIEEDKIDLPFQFWPGIATTAYSSATS